MEGRAAPRMGNDITVTALSLPLPFRHRGLRDGGTAVYGASHSIGQGGVSLRQLQMAAAAVREH